MVKEKSMKKGLLSSYIFGITDSQNGKSYERIIRYFIPEFITALVLYSFLKLLDAAWIAHLKSTSMYATLGVTNTLLHFIIKVAEGLSVGTIVLTGCYNGIEKFKEAGRSLVDAFWTTVFLGLTISGGLYFGAPYIYAWYGVPVDMIAMGVPFLRLRALSILFMFVYFALIGFLRGIKNTKAPMSIFMIGALVFIFFDYALIFGKFGFTRMELMGSAMASVLQYGSMLLLAVGYIFFVPRHRKYSLELFSVFKSGSQLKQLFYLSWPVMLDKAAMSMAYIWLGAMIAPMGKYALASFSVVKDLERFAFLPAIAFAQVVTFLVSNDYGIKNWQGIKSNIKKILFISSVMVSFSLFALSMYPHYFVSFFDKQGEFIGLAARVLPILSVLVFFDLLQLILSGAMRGASNVKIVMVTRVVVCIGYFMPVSYFFSKLLLVDPTVKFLLIYGSFYVGNGLMSFVYINRFRGEQWKQQIN